MKNSLKEKFMNLLNRIKYLRDNFRELVWPLLDPLENNTEDRKTTNLLEESNYTWDDNEIQYLLYLVEKYKESEDDRLKTVESKSIIFIGSFGIAITILTSLVNNIAFQLIKSINLTHALLLLLITITILYLCRSVWFSIKALERQEYHKIGLPKFMLTNIDENKKKFVIESYNGIKKNQEKINLKVDYMVMAQEYFKRAIVVVFMFTSVYFVNMIIYLAGQLF